MKKDRTMLYRVLVRVARFIYLFFGYRAYGTENYPTDRNFIVLGNHISNWDPISIAISCKQWEISFLAKESLFKFKPLGWLIRKLHAMPVARGGGSNMAVMRNSLSVLREGRVLGIFPEGHRYHTGQIEKMETGVAVIAFKSGLPLVPVFIGGKYRLFGKIRVFVGEPIDIDDLREQGSSTETLEAIKDRLQEALMTLQKQAEDAK